MKLRWSSTVQSGTNSSKWKKKVGTVLREFLSQSPRAIEAGAKSLPEKINRGSKIESNSQFFWLRIFSLAFYDSCSKNLRVNGEPAWKPRFYKFFPWILSWNNVSYLLAHGLAGCYMNYCDLCMLAIWFQYLRRFRSISSKTVIPFNNISRSINSYIQVYLTSFAPIYAPWNAIMALSYWLQFYLYLRAE